MPAIKLVAVGLTDPPVFNGPLAGHFIDPPLTLAVLNGGMTSGEPSVCLGIETPNRLILVETSLAIWLASAHGAAALARERFGWEQKP